MIFRKKTSELCWNLHTHTEQEDMNFEHYSKGKVVHVAFCVCSLYVMSIVVFNTRLLCWITAMVTALPSKVASTCLNELWDKYSVFNAQGRSGSISEYLNFCTLRTIMNFLKKIYPLNRFLINTCQHVQGLIGLSCMQLKLFFN